MIFKNLFRRKGRTLLTVFGISIGVAAIIGLGTLAEGLRGGYDAMFSGSKADLVLSQPDTYDISLSTVDEEIGAELAAMPEVSAVSSLIQGIVQTENVPYFFVYGYPSDSFVLDRFNILEGVGLNTREAERSRGKPILLGKQASESLKKRTGDTIRLTESAYRIVGIYETGDTLEDSGAVLRTHDAQDLLGRQRQVSLFYIQLKDGAQQDRFEKRVDRLWNDLSISSTEDFNDSQLMDDNLQGFVWGIAGLAIIVGGVSMMNAQLMSVIERTREIGVLRSVGWSRRRVLLLILGESIVVSLLGGLLGVFLGWLTLTAFADIAKFFGATTANIRPELLVQAFGVVLTLGLLGGLYPAWRASRLMPVEALRYEGGSASERARRLPIGGMAVQSLWQRSARTFLTLGAIGIAVGGIISLEAIVRGMSDFITGMSADTEIMVRQAGIADTGYSTLDERVGDKIAAMPEVAHVSGMMFSAVVMPETGGFFILFGYAPNEYAIQLFNVVDGNKVTNNHQIMLGRLTADAMNKKVGDTIDLSGNRFRVVGIYETGTSWMELGGVVTLRDVQAFSGRPRKVMLYNVKLKDASQAEHVVENINIQIPEAYASLTGEFVEQMPDMRAMDGIMAGISFLAILVGGIGVLNTMLMAVLERTREIGVMRALGWRRFRVLGLILREALLLGLLGGASGILLGLAMTSVFKLLPFFGDALTPFWEIDIFLRAVSIALLLGLLGGIYPALRATRLEPVEALRYE